MNYKSGPYFIYLFLLFSFSLFAQSPNEIIEITKEYDLTKLNFLQEKFSNDFLREKSNALSLASQKGWDITYTDGSGSYHELIRVSKTGTPIYYKTNNVAAAVSTRANYLHTGGGLGLDIEGQGMTAYVWDGGLARTTHQEFTGESGESRFTIGDTSSALNFHAAHVMGTIIASGVNASAKGMAPKAKGIGSDWNSDLSEATEAAANGMLVSNHSYGYNANDINDSRFGAYLEDARNWDDLMYNAPYYLQVNSAGNDGNNNTANGDPLEENSAFDKLNGDNTSKNSLIIANSQDAVIDAEGQLISVARNSGSSEGPTDDFRVKPDIMGNGTGLFSTYESSDTAYNSISGTSMASPNVAGSLLLLQQHYNNLNGNFMLASTLKGLALHTADDADIAGPDPHVGWGLMNTKVAAETITKRGFESWISEESLSNGETYTIKLKSDGFNPLLASISWTDKPGELSTGTNSSTPALVNDLDIRVTKDSEEFMPWKLTGVYSNEKGDNLVDPFERVDVENASGEYTITVTHKGTLTEDQNFSLVVTGIAGEFNFITDLSKKPVCTNSDVTFNFEYKQAITTTTQFSLEGVPAGVTGTLSSDSLDVDGILDVTFSNLEGLAVGSYEVNVVGDNGTDTQKRKVTIFVYSDSFSGYGSELELPLDGQDEVSPSTVVLSWKQNSNAQSYLVEVSETSSFDAILFTDTVTDTRFNLNNLNVDTIYFWRVQPTNQCGEGDYSTVFSFKTVDCVACDSFGNTSYDSSTTLVQFNTIDKASTKENGGYSDFKSTNTRVRRNESHNLTVKVNTAGNTSMHTLAWIDWNQNCSFDDEGEQYDLGDVRNVTNGSPSLSPLSITIPSDAVLGNVVMRITTMYNKDPTSCSVNFDGEVEDYTIIIEDEATASVEGFSFNGFNLYPNPSKGDFNLQFEVVNTDKVSVQLFDLRGRLINQKNFFNTQTNFSEEINFNKAVSGLYLVKITNGDKQTTRKLVIE